MRAFLLGCLAIVAVGAGGYFLLNAVQQPSGMAFATDGARISPSWAWREPSTAAPPSPTPSCDPRKSWQWFFVDLGSPEGESAICKISQ